ncbi:hypothetical protein MF672_021150 [Actinomadura sp. ATCC 31491]|uniref:histidine kinase n=1 Tax=Actinomadura luzonensis TaxID=2805427 RepID=A0ABT0FVD5_9ACTN|nr:hypothetical protein [Actinomadura luzonensis]MCK2216289.1 hypothetical protein [Actinomadura luzonensis]
MITPDLLVGALLGAVLAAAVFALTGALLWQARAKRAALRARDVARRDARAAEQKAETARKNADTAAQQAEINKQWYDAAAGEFGRLVERLRAVADIEAGHPSVELPGLLHECLAETAVAVRCKEAEQLFKDRAAAIRADVSAAARSGVRGVADTAQAALTRLQIKIDEELDDHAGAHAYHQGLVEIDHLATQALHSLQRLRILAGSWPGVQREDCTFREIVESARGRIGPYLRVDHTYQADVGEVVVEGRVAEPIIVALAELLDNATSYSDDRVDVYVQAVQAGYRVVVEDRGLGMNGFQRAEAEHLLSSGTPMDAAALRDERRLGFAVAGRLAHEYGFRVDVSAPSSSGGVKAVCLVPTHMIIRVPADAADPFSTEFTSPGPAGAGAGTGAGTGDGVPYGPGHPDWATLPDQFLPPAPAVPLAGEPGEPGEPREEPPAQRPAAADVPLTTASGLPKRRAQQPVRRPAAPAAAQRPMTDAVPADDLDAGMGSIFEALRAAYADRDTDQGQPQP